MRNILKESTLADLKQAFDGAIEDIKASFEGAIQEAYEAGRNSVMDEPEVKTVKRKAKVGEKILITKTLLHSEQYQIGSVFVVDKSSSWGTIITTKGDVFVIREYEVIIEEPKTANEQRAELIQKAKEFVENESEFYFVDFVVNEEKRTVVALIRFSSGRVYTKGIAKCMPDEVFNAGIGKAIALARALEIDVPEEFLNAVQPTEKVLGMVVYNDIYKESARIVYRVASLKEEAEVNSAYATESTSSTTQTQNIKRSDKYANR